MFPIAKATLSFGEIADYWSREISPPASWDEILRTLESAWWLGELRGNSSPTRLQRLKYMFNSMRQRDDLEIVFIVGGGPRPVELPNGSLKVDLRHQIRVPSNNTERWNEATCRNAFHTLATTGSKESYPELTVNFTLTELSYEEFNTWRAKRGYDEPKFWKPREQLLVTRQERKTWQAKPRKRLTATEAAVVRTMNELWPNGRLDFRAKARDERIQNQLGKEGPVSPRTIQRTLKKIRFV